MVKRVFLRASLCIDEFCSVIGLDFSWIDLVVLEVLEQSTGQDRGVDQALFVSQAYKQSPCFDVSGTILERTEWHLFCNVVSSSWGYRTDV